MPPCASSNSPGLAARASVNAPRTWPNSSSSTSEAEIAAQFTLMNGPLRRGPRRCTPSATSSFPLPLSPRISTVESAAAVRATRSRRAAIAGERPRISPSPVALRRQRSSDSSAARPSALRTEVRSRSRENGFSMKSKTPRRSASTVSLIVASPEITIVGGRRPEAASSRTRSMPLRPGSRTSSSSRSGRGIVEQGGRRVLGRGRADDLVAHVAQLGGEARARPRVVLDDDQSRHDASAGSSSRNAAPFSLSRSSRSPPWSSRILREIARPRPMPCPGGELVT